MRIEFMGGSLAVLMFVGQVAAQPVECGRISQFDVAPRGRQVYPVRVLAIDGRIPWPSSSDVFRVAPGTHAVQVAELINVEEFSGVELRRRNVRNYAQAVITFEVEPGYTYFIGAQSFLRKNSNAIAVQRKREYWAPVVYQRIAERCR